MAVGSEPAFDRFRFRPMNPDLDFGIISCIFRDSRGFLWLGEEDAGLVRYDGYQIFRYKNDPDNPHSVREDYVRNIIEDPHGNIWVAWKRGVSRYVPRDDSFIHYLHDATDPFSLADSSIAQVYLSPSGDVWVVTATALNRYLPENNAFVRFDLPQSDLMLTSMTIDANGAIWAVSMMGGIHRLHQETGDFEFYPDPQASEEECFKKLLTDSNGTIWIGCKGDGLIRFHPHTRHFFHYPTSGNGVGTTGRLIWDLLEYPKGQLLLAVNQGGLNRLDIQRDTFSYQSMSDTTDGRLSGDGSTSLFIDQEEILWLGSSRSGIDHYNPKTDRFNVYHKQFIPNVDSLLDNVIGCFEEDADGFLWIGTDGSGISILDRKTGSFTNIPANGRDGLLPSGIVRSISRDGFNRMWVCFWDGGMVILEKSGDQIVRYREKDDRLAQFQKDSFWSSFVDSRQRVWISLSNGRILLFDYDLNPIAEFEESGDSQFDNTTVFREVDGRLFVSQRFGLFEYDEEKNLLIERIKTPASVTHIFDGVDRFYTASVDSGLQVYDLDGQLLRVITEDEGLSMRYVNSIEIAEDGDLWIGTRKGLNRYDPQSGKITQYFESAGISGNSFFFQSSLQLKSGEMCFGTNKGFMVFHPLSIVDNSLIPGVYIHEVLINQKRVNFRDQNAPFKVHPHFVSEIELEYWQNFLEFRFVAVNLTYSANNRYAYKLEGLDNDWIESEGNHRSANYTGLKPGNYTFRVIASNNDGVWNNEGCSVAITIHPPFWGTPWFYALVVLAGIASVLSFIYFRERKLKRNNLLLEATVAARTRIVEDQKSELEAQGVELLKHKDRLEELIVERTRELLAAKERAERSDQLKSRFLANMSHEIRTPLNAIVGLSSFIGDSDLELADREEFISAIASNSNSLLHLIEDILDVSMLESNQVRIAKEPFSINDLIQNLYLSSSSSYAKPGLRFEKANELESLELSLVSDPLRVKQILNNLITNAAKFSGQGTITIGVTQEQQGIAFFVSDEGPGIPDEAQESIFGEFVKLQKDELMAMRGVGLGLSISRRLANLLEAGLSLDSTLGVGSTFWLRFPAEMVVESIDQPYLPCSTPVSSSRSFKEKSFLIVENEHSNYLFLNEALGRLSDHVDWAESGEKALELIQSKHYDLVFLDIQMPGLSGYEVLKSIRTIRPEMKVISQTSFAFPDDRARIRQAAFDGNLWKPIDPVQLFDLIDQIV